MKRNRIFIGLGILAAILSLLSVTDLMRESDQASILTGAWNLSRGSNPFHADYYNYDKQYLTYWLLAATFRVLAAFRTGWSPVFVGNLWACATFWLTTLVALFRLARRNHSPSPLALALFLTSPAILLNSFCLSTAIVSAGFVLLAGVLLTDSRDPRSRALAIFFFFLAVGARADAILVAPLLAWLILPRRNGLRAGLKNRSLWGLALAGVAALEWGAKIFSADRVVFDFTFRGLKVIAAYLVFGLGALLPVLAGILVLLTTRALRARDRERKIFYGAGVFSLLLPFLYYSAQFYTPRYLILSATGVFLFCVSPRGRRYLRVCSRQRPFRVSATLTAALACALLLIGIRLPAPTTVRLTTSRPTLFPTDDGLYPMGAYGEFLLALKNAPRRQIDHNQEVWRAAQAASYLPRSDGYVHLYRTPMLSYSVLAVTLQGLVPLVSPNDGQAIYADSRSLIHGLTAPESEKLLTKPAVFASPSYDGIGIIRFNQGGNVRWGDKARLLRQYFASNDYREFAASAFEQRLDAAGRPFAFIADEPFEVSHEPAPRDPASGLYLLPGQAVTGPPYPLSAAHPEQITLAIQALPGWMSAPQP